MQRNALPDIQSSFLSCEKDAELILNKLFEKYGDKITFNNPANFQYAFYVMGLEEFPYTISGGASNGTRTSVAYMFYNNPTLKKIGELKNIAPSAM